MYANHSRYDTVGCDKSVRIELEKQSTCKHEISLLERNPSSGCVSGILSFLVIKVIEKPRTQGGSTQSKVSLKRVWRFASPPIAVLQFFKNHENIKIQ